MAHAEGRTDGDDILRPPVAATAHGVARRQWIVLAALNVTWALVMARFGRGDIYWVVGLHALAVCVVVFAVRGRALCQTVVPRGQDVLLGVVTGVGMTAGTYIAFEAVQALVPALGGHVVRLYRAAGTNAPATALAWTLIILTAEELLWRGAWLDVWAPRIGMRAAAVSSVMAFTATQLGSGSAIVALVACVCGAIWTGLRVRTGSVVPGLVAHAIWTPTVILFHPVI